MSEAPTDDGVRLATIARSGDRELRLRLCRYKGHAYIDVREWAASPQTGEWWPVKGKGTTIKPRELEAVLAALQTALEHRDNVDHLPTNSR